MATFTGREILAAVLLCAACLAAPPPARGQGTDPMLDLVDPHVLRVCADPSNLPFSNKEGEGFENKLAELLAQKLGKKLSYTWFPQAVGFVRNTLGAHKCDVIIGFPQGDELVQNTNAYYRTAYTLVSKPGNGLEDVTQLSDPRLKGKRIGVVAGTPPATYLAVNGLMGQARPYHLMIDTRVDSSAAAMIKDVENGAIDAGVLWGPMAGYYARRTDPPLRVVPLIKESGGPRLVYRITMGVRAADQNWKRTLNTFIEESQPEINRLLIGYGVPLLDERDQPITEQTLTKRP